MRRGEMLALRFKDIARGIIVLRGETTKSRKTTRCADRHDKASCGP